MPCYHFHIRNALTDAPDEEGLDLAGLDAARGEAIKGIRSFLGHELANGTMDLRGRIDIEDDAGNVLLAVPFRDAVVITFT